VSNSQWWKGGSTRAWRKVRLAVLNRDQWRCQLQIPGICTTRATHVHHVRGKQHGDDPAYLLSSCQACNLHIGDPERMEADPDPRPSTLL
jgi:hypothetical protein